MTSYSLKTEVIDELLTNESSIYRHPPESYPSWEDESNEELDSQSRKFVG